MEVVRVSPSERLERIYRCAYSRVQEFSNLFYYFSLKSQERTVPNFPRATSVQGQYLEKICSCVRVEIGAVYKGRLVDEG